MKDKEGKSVPEYMLRLAGVSLLLSTAITLFSLQDRSATACTEVSVASTYRVCTDSRTGVTVLIDKNTGQIHDYNLHLKAMREAQESK